jgi:hypothetical protein
VFTTDFGTVEKKADGKEEEKIVGTPWPILSRFFLMAVLALDDSDIQILKTYVCYSIVGECLGRLFYDRVRVLMRPD